MIRQLSLCSFPLNLKKCSHKSTSNEHVERHEFLRCVPWKDAKNISLQIANWHICGAPGLALSGHEAVTWPSPSQGARHKGGRDLWDADATSATRKSPCFSIYLFLGTKLQPVSTCYCLLFFEIAKGLYFKGGCGLISAWNWQMAPSAAKHASLSWCSTVVHHKGDWTTAVTSTATILWHKAQLLEFFGNVVADFGFATPETRF